MGPCLPPNFMSIQCNLPCKCIFMIYAMRSYVLANILLIFMTNVVFFYILACDHKKTQSDTDQCDSRRTPQVVPLDELFCGAQRAALTTMANQSYGKSRNGEAIAKTAAAVLTDTPAMESLASPMKDLFTVDVITQAERENMLSKFHRVRSDLTIRDSVLGSLRLQCSRKVQVLFYQSYLSELLACMLSAYVDGVKQCVAKDRAPYKMTDTDREVLYHVAGFVIKRVSSVKGLLSPLVQTFGTSDPTDVPSGWTAALDRGGLKYATMDFYKFIFECDQVISEAAKRVSTNCLLKDSTVELVMDNQAVKLVWDSICNVAGVTIASTMTTMEAVVKTFFTVKGFSVAHRARQGIALKLRQKQSLRHSLR